MNVVYADKQGNIFDMAGLRPAAMSGNNYVLPELRDFIPLPDGSRLFTLPHTQAVGFDPKNKKFIPLAGKNAVAVFLPPAYTRTLLPATRYPRSTPYLPLWPYSAVMWHKQRLWGAGVLIDQCTRWQPHHFDDRKLVPRVKKKLKEIPDNRLLHHLAHCACNYHCFAAKNLFFKRWECPLPTSPICNAACLGCLSLQSTGTCPASHQRIDFVPTVREICEIAIPHLQKATYAIASFGQGCEGDPILQYRILGRAIRKIRKKTNRGVININTNASLPQAIPLLAKAGLNSLRVSMSSPQPELYHRYFQPNGYSFSDVLASMALAKKHGLYLMLNLFVTPGATDTPAEIAALFDLIENYRIDMIQLRNLSLDPRLYFEQVCPETHDAIGILNLIDEVRRHFPNLRLGYFNQANLRKPSSHRNS